MVLPADEIPEVNPTPEADGIEMIRDTIRNYSNGIMQ